MTHLTGSADAPFQIWLRLLEEEIEVLPLRGAYIVPEFDVYVMDLNKYSDHDIFRQSWLNQCGPELLLAGRFSLRVLDAIGDCQRLKQAVVAAMANVLNAHTHIQEMSPKMLELAEPLGLDSEDGRRNCKKDLYSHCERVASVPPATDGEGIEVRKVEAESRFNKYIDTAKLLMILDHYNALFVGHKLHDRIPALETTIAQLRSNLMDDVESRFDFKYFLDKRVLDMFLIEPP